MENPIQRTEDEEADKAPKWLNVILVLLIAFTVFMIAWAIDLMAFNARYYLKLTLTPACEYKMPADFKLVTDGKFWAIEKGADMCLHEGRFGVDDTFKSISEPSLFFDSCQAKSYCKKYIEKRYGNKMEGFH